MSDKKINITENEVSGTLEQEKLSEIEIHRLQNNVLEEIRKSEHYKKKARKRGTGWKVAVAACLVALIVPSTTYAAKKIYRYLTVSVKNPAEYKVEMKLKGTASEDSGKLAYMDLDYSAVTDRYEVKEAEKGKEGQGYYLFNYKTNDSENRFQEETTHFVSCQVIRVDNTEKQKATLLFTDVKEKSEEKVNGNTAYYILNGGVEGSSNEEYGGGAEIYVICDEEGYILKFNVGAAYDKDEALALISGITLKEAKDQSEEGSVYVSLSDYLREDAISEEDLKWFQDGDQWEKSKTKIDKSQIASGRKIQKDTGLQVKVEAVTVSDKMPLDKDKYYDGWELIQWKNRSVFSEEDGTLKDYTREIVQYGDGVNELGRKVVGSEQVKQKFVEITFRVKNATDGEWSEYYNLFNNIAYLKKSKSGEDYVTTGGLPDSDVYQEYLRPREVEICQMGNSENGGDLFSLQTAAFCRERKIDALEYIELEPGDEKEFHMGYFVDEDLLDCAYFAVASNGFQDDEYDFIKLVE